MRKIGDSLIGDLFSLCFTVLYFIYKTGEFRCTSLCNYLSYQEYLGLINRNLNVSFLHLKLRFKFLL